MLFYYFINLIEGLKEENSYPFITRSAEEDDEVFVFENFTMSAGVSSWILLYLWLTD